MNYYQIIKIIELSRGLGFFWAGKELGKKNKKKRLQFFHRNKTLKMWGVFFSGFFRFTCRRRTYIYMGADFYEIFSFSLFMFHSIEMNMTF